MIKIHFKSDLRYMTMSVQGQFRTEMITFFISMPIGIDDVLRGGGHLSSKKACKFGNRTFIKMACKLGLKIVKLPSQYLD